jgi:predicted dehydrogenase
LKKGSYSLVANHHNVSEVSRRRFLAGSLAGMTLAGLPDWFVSEAVAQEKQRAADMPMPRQTNDTIRVGLIGAGGSKGGFRQGLNVARGVHGQPGCRVIAVCDVDKVHRDEAQKAFGEGTQAYVDYRELLARPDIDAVVIGTPDHWHGVMSVAAMRAGKHVYCEKPLTLTINEGKAIARTAKQTGRTFQTGSQQRSDARFRLACELVRNGRIGQVKRVEARLPGAPAGGPFPAQPVPADLDWDRWLGPAPRADYLKERTHGSFRYWYEYAGGMVTDWGAHHLDITQWGLGMDGSGPSVIESKGTLPEQAKQPNAYNVHTSYDITYIYRPLFGGAEIPCWRPARAKTACASRATRAGSLSAAARSRRATPRSSKRRCPRARSDCMPPTITSATLSRASAPASPVSATPRSAIVR